MIDGAPLNVLDYGAAGDGVANDSAAIVAAMTAASAAKKSVFFPAGTYRLLTHIELISNISFVGEPGSQIFFDPAMTVGTVIGGTARAMYAQNKSNITFENIRFYSTATGVTKPLTICFENQVGLNLYNTQFDTFGDVTYYAQGIILYGSSKVRFENTRFLNCSGDGAAFSNDCNNISVTNSEFSDNADWGLAFSIGCYDAIIEGCLFKNNTSTATGADRCRKIAFIGNTMVNNEHGVRVAEFVNTAEYNQQITIVGNNITNVAVAGISVENLFSPFGLVSVSGNTISGSSNQGIRVVNAANVSVVGNAIYSCGADAILFSALDAGFTTGLSTVIGNTIDTCTYGVRQIETAGVTAPITVVGNRISNASVAGVDGVSSAALELIDGNESVNYTRFSRALSFPSAIISSSATAGANAVPANAYTFLPVYIDGVQKKIAVYNV
jgi:polygalacturonase